jgi:serine/threonine protein kinase
VALHAEFRDRYYNNSHSSGGSGSGSNPSSPVVSSAANKKEIASSDKAAAAADEMMILAPPLCNAKVMKATDNVFCGLECGVDDTLLADVCGDGVCSPSSLGSSTSTNSGASDNNTYRYYINDEIMTATPGERGISSTAVLPQDHSFGGGVFDSEQAAAAAATGGGEEKQWHDAHQNHHRRQSSVKKPRIFPKTPEEEEFITSALTDTDTNFILDGISPHLRQTLMSQMERITVPQYHLLIRRGDTPDYLYLLYEGEIAVYIDPSECMEEDCVIDIKIKHSNSSNSLRNMNNNKSTGIRSPQSMSELSGGTGGGELKKRNEFKQSYVLNLRKSLFQSSIYDNNFSSSSSNNNIHHNNNILGQVISLVRGSFSMGGTTTNNDAAITAAAAAVAAADTSTPITGGGWSSGTAATTSSSLLPALVEDTSCDDTETEMSFTPLKDLQRLRHERDLGPMDVFGELALIYNCPRTASCLTTTPCTLYRVEGEIFKSILSSSNADREKMRWTESKAALEALNNLGVVENWLDEKSLSDLSNVLNPITFHRGDMVMTKGDYDKIFFFVMSGKLLAHDIGTGDSRKVDLELVDGNHFGELNLLTNRPSVANVTVISPKVRLMAITKKDYNKRRESLEPLMRKLWQRNALLTIPVIAKSKLLPHEINMLVQKLERVIFPRGKVVFSSEEMKSALYILEQGKMQLVISNEDHGIVNTFELPDHFGGRSLFDPKFFQGKDIQLRALVDTECLMLSRASILQVIGKITRLGTATVPVARKLVKNMKRSDLKLHRIIGVGAFGRVWLASHRTRKTVYALKVMDKKEIVAKKMAKGVIREKNVLASVEHPFIVGLVATFQDDFRVYMVQNYVQGGELLGLIYNVSKKGYLSNDAAAFYGACIVEALIHLHSRSICHRDLKPENILINAAGYVVLADFGFAKVILDKTYTTCGSPEYMAPEMLLGKGHSFAVDYWALGVVLYEMLVGQTPFIHVGATRMTLFRRICRGKIAFPDSKKHGIDVQTEAKQLIVGLLNKDIAERVGSSLAHGDEPLRTNTWFQGLLTDYHHVFLAEKVSPPWFPDVDDELDASYFESHDDLEKALLSKERKETPLDWKSQRMFEGF